MAILVVSYPRVHQPQVRALVMLLRAAIPTVEEAVFWDDDFKPGQKWFDQFTGAIDRAQKLFVFWCGHAAASEQVRREYAYALERQCIVVPVLFDNAPLHPELAEIHGIDLRSVIQHVPPAYGEPSQAGVEIDRYAQTLIEVTVDKLAGGLIARRKPPDRDYLTRHQPAVERATELFKAHLSD